MSQQSIPKKHHRPLPQSILHNHIHIPDEFLRNCRQQTKFKEEQEVDHDHLAEIMSQSVEISEVSGTVGFYVHLHSMASHVLPALGQAVCVRDIGNTQRLKPIFLVTPSASSMQKAAESGSGIIERSRFFVHVKVPGKVPGVMINRIKPDQEYVLLNIYRSAWGTSYQVSNLKGELEAITHKLTMYGLNEIQRKMLSSFIGETLADNSVASFKTKQYRALPLGVFTEVNKVMLSEGYEACQHLDPSITISMKTLLIEACRRGGHDPDARTRDAAYVGDPDKEVTKEDMFPYNWALPSMGVDIVEVPAKRKKDHIPSLHEAGV